MLDYDNPFSPPLTLTAIEARRALQYLVQHRGVVSVVAEAHRAERLCSVTGTGTTGWNTLILEQPASGAPESSAFAPGEALELAWAESGSRYGARAQVVRLRAGNPPTYEIEVHPELRRLERRKARRVLVEPDDGVRAELLLDGRAEPLPAILKDLSVEGCRLAVTTEQAAHTASLEPGAQPHLTLSLPDHPAAQEGQLLLLRVEHNDECVREFGAAWLAPTSDFIDRIARFVAIKHHALAHRRAER